MDASHRPPQKTKRATKNCHIPVEILEEILLNLTVKSLLRFSSVSKSWNSIIFGSEFVQKYHGCKRVVLSQSPSRDLNHLSCCPLSTVLRDNLIVNAAVLACPFEHPTRMKALCDELWCVEDNITSSLFLWIPSMGKYKKLPNPSRQSCVSRTFCGRLRFEFLDDDSYNTPRQYESVYGLGYDKVGDDNKILKVGLEVYKPRVAELYSLRSDSWREIGAFPGDFTISFSSGEQVAGDFHCKGVFVAGAVHWLVVPYNPGPNSPDGRAIVSFDLSTESYGVVGVPEFDQEITNSLTCKGEIRVLRGMLCLGMNYCLSGRFVLWVMEDYGVVDSWTVKLDIDCKSVVGLGKRCILTPFYFYDNGQFLIKVSTGGGEKSCIKILLCKDEQTLRWKIFRRGCCISVSDSFVYVESLVSPAMWPTSAAPVGKHD